MTTNYMKPLWSRYLKDQSLKSIPMLKRNLRINTLLEDVEGPVRINSGMIRVIRRAKRILIMEYRLLRKFRTAIETSGLTLISTTFRSKTFINRGKVILRSTSAQVGFTRVMSNMMTEVTGHSKIA